MALFRITAASVLLLALAPDQTLRAARGALGLAEGAAAPTASQAEAAMEFCRARPQVCLEAARAAMRQDRRQAADAARP